MRLRGPFRSAHPHVVIGAGSRDLSRGGGGASSGANWRDGLAIVNDSLLHAFYGGGTPPGGGRRSAGGGNGGSGGTRRMQPRRAVSAGPVRKLARFCADGVKARPLSSTKSGGGGVAVVGGGRKQPSPLKPRRRPERV